MWLLLLRLALAPLLVGAGSAAQRRWGQAVGGRIIGLPLTSVPLLYLLVLSQGRAFAAHAAVATLAGVSAQAVLTWAYARVGCRRGPVASLVACLAAFAVTVGALGLLRPGPVVGALLATATLAVLLRWWPAGVSPGHDVPAGGTRRNSTSLRMVLAAVFAVAVTGLASALGPTAAGLLTALPVLSVVMLTLTHRDDGRKAMGELAHGIQRGTFSVVTALLLLALVLPTGHVALAFAAAIVASVLTQLATAGSRARRAIPASPRRTAPA